MIDAEPETAGTLSVDFSHDIPLSLAIRAHSGTSHVPERRGEQERAGYAGFLAADFEALSRLATTDEKRATLATEFARYREGYRSHYVTMLSAKGRCLSTMISGPSGFNTRRHQTSSDRADRRTQDLLTFRERALKAIRRALTPELQPIMTSDANAGERIDAKVAKLEATQAKYKAINLAIRQNAKAGPDAQTAAIVALGWKEATARKLLEPDFAGRVGIPAYELTNNATNIRRLKLRATVVEALQSEPATETEGVNGIRIEDCPADNRVRLYFTGKPSAEVRASLKARAFRWTPSLGCWQAYRNTSAIEFARKVAS